MIRPDGRSKDRESAKLCPFDLAVKWAIIWQTQLTLQIKGAAQ